MPELVVYGLVDGHDHRIGHVEASVNHRVRCIYWEIRDACKSRERGLDAQDRPCDFETSG